MSERQKSNEKNPDLANDEDAEEAKEELIRAGRGVRATRPTESEPALGVNESDYGDEGDDEERESAPKKAQEGDGAEKRPDEDDEDASSNEDAMARQEKAMRSIQDEETDD